MSNKYKGNNHYEINGGQVECMGDNNIVSGNVFSNNEGQINVASGNSTINTSQTHYGNGDNVSGDKIPGNKVNRNITISGNKGVIRNINTSNGSNNNSVTVYFDGDTLIIESDIEKVKVTYNGNIRNLKCDGSVTIYGSVEGNIKCGGSCKCDNVNGGINADGSVNCNNVGGDIDAGGSVNYRR